MKWQQCEPYLFRQIDAIKPRVIVPLGKFAAQSLLKTMDPITRLRGRQFDYRGTALIPTFHPAYLLRNPSAKREVWEDMKKVRAILQSEVICFSGLIRNSYFPCLIGSSLLRSRFQRWICLTYAVPARLAMPADRRARRWCPSGRAR